MIKNFGHIKNITLPHERCEIYASTDGLSLQNLFYTQNGFFPNCFLFDNESRNNGDYYFDTKNMIEELISTYKDDIQIVTYYNKTLNETDEDKSLKLSFCCIISKYNIYARFDKSVTDSYVLYSNAYPVDVEDFIDIALKYHKAPNNGENTYWRICSSQGEYYLERGKIKCPENIDIKKIYNDDFEKEDIKIHKFIEEDDKSGLIILHGEKGTGKSTYIKHLVNLYPNRKFVYVPANLIPLLGDPSFGSFLTTLNNHIVVLEDCENAIKDRKSNSTASAVSLLLNMTDGILSDDLGMKFICTFNANMKDIDPALLRKGRLVSKYEFKPLQEEKAIKILGERGIDVELDKPLTLAEIFHFEDDEYNVTNKPII